MQVIPLPLSQTPLSQAILLENKPLRRPVSAAALRSVKDIAVYSLVTNEFSWFDVVCIYSLYLKSERISKVGMPNISCGNDGFWNLNFRISNLSLRIMSRSSHLRFSPFFDTSTMACLTSAGHDGQHLPSGADGTDLAASIGFECSSLRHDHLSIIRT